MNRLQTPGEWLKFFRNGLIVSVVAVGVLFWDSPHPADEIAVSIAIPLIIFNCIPIILAGSIAAFRCLIASPQMDLPVPRKPPTFNDLPLGRKIRALATVFIVIAMIVAFFASIAIFAATLLYGYSGIPWAIGPARELALVTFVITVLPIVGVFSFIAGMYYSGKLWNSLIAVTIYVETIRPLTYWPTAPA